MKYANTQTRLLTVSLGENVSTSLIFLANKLFRSQMKYFRTLVHLCVVVCIWPYIFFGMYINVALGKKLTKENGILLTFVELNYKYVIGWAEFSSFGSSDWHSFRQRTNQINGPSSKETTFNELSQCLKLRKNGN